MRPLLTTIASIAMLISLPACRSQASLDRSAFLKASRDCGIEGLQFRLTKPKQLGAYASLSPLRWLGDWLIEKRRRDQKLPRYYWISLPVPLSNQGAPVVLDRRQEFDRARENKIFYSDYLCVSRNVNSSGILIDTTAGWPPDLLPKGPDGTRSSIRRRAGEG